MSELGFQILNLFLIRKRGWGSNTCSLVFYPNFPLDPDTSDTSKSPTSAAQCCPALGKAGEDKDLSTSNDTPGTEKPEF